MKAADISRMDLNLLFVFEAVMQERSVTRAAQRLNVSQSTISHALNRLRTVLKDELFIRGSGEMRPTPRAVALSTAVIPTLTHIRAALAPTEFNPAKAQRTFQIAMTDYFATLHLDDLVQIVRAQAPGIDLRIKLNVLQQAWAMLDKQEADLIVGMIDQPPDRFATELLYEDGVAVVMAPGNPLAKKPLTLESYAAAKHVYIPVDGIIPIHTGRIDRALEMKGLVRRHVLTVSQFALAPSIIASTDYILSCPRRAGEMCSSRYKLRVVDCPVELPLQPTRVVWHPQLGNDGANRWLTQVLHEVVSKRAKPRITAARRLDGRRS
jgi:DNA-binding transcriptional LysR family regulator